MSEEQDGKRGTDQDQTKLQLNGLIQGNQTFENYLDSLPEYLNVTLLHGNGTNVFDSFYFYEVSSRKNISPLNIASP